jgi:hypothetical protein
MRVVGPYINCVQRITSHSAYLTHSVLDDGAFCWPEENGRTFKHTSFPLDHFRVRLDLWGSDAVVIPTIDRASLIAVKPSAEAAKRD